MTKSKKRVESEIEKKKAWPRVCERKRDFTRLKQRKRKREEKEREREAER